MNTKSVLIATLFAAAAGSAFAADYVATAGNPEMQIAQSAAARPEARVVTRSGTAVTANAASKDDTYGNCSFLRCNLARSAASCCIQRWRLSFSPSLK